jgi:hypothetical protein
MRSVCDEIQLSGNDHIYISSESGGASSIGRWYHVPVMIYALFLHSKGQ